MMAKNIVKVALRIENFLSSRDPEEFYIHGHPVSPVIKVSLEYLAEKVKASQEDVKSALPGVIGWAFAEQDGDLFCVDTDSGNIMHVDADTPYEREVDEDEEE